MDSNRNIRIMGIVNLTDDSYVAQSRCMNLSAALERIGCLLDEGASIVDLGACSTRPGAFPVGMEEEWRRLEPVLKNVMQEFPGIRISVDTYWSEIVRRTYDLIGDFIVNDISAGEDDPQMLKTVGDLGLCYIAMHKRGKPSTMHMHNDYTDVTGELLTYFKSFAEKALKFGIKEWILDPGFGFAKDMEQNYKLLRELNRFKTSFHAADHEGSSVTYVPELLVGISRKSLIYKLFDITPEESLSATQVLHHHALINGADILRVHDVAEAVRTVELYRRLA